jgi:CheY-like chemotaxis protein
VFEDRQARGHRYTAKPHGAARAMWLDRRTSVAHSQTPILIVDHDVASARALRRLLRKWGYHNVHCEHSASAALESAVAFSPAIILLDIELPDMSGYELARALHQHPRLQSTQGGSVRGHRVSSAISSSRSPQRRFVRFSTPLLPTASRTHSASDHGALYGWRPYVSNKVRAGAHIQSSGFDISARGLDLRLP